MHWGCFFPIATFYPKSIIRLVSNNSRTSATLVSPRPVISIAGSYSLHRQLHGPNITSMLIKEDT